MRWPVTPSLGVGVPQNAIVSTAAATSGTSEGIEGVAA